MTDKRRLSTKRPYRETGDVVIAVQRLIRATGRRVAQEDPADVLYLQGLQETLDAAWADAVAGLRHSGYSDTQIGRPLEITKQAVAQRWPHDREPEDR